MSADAKYKATEDTSRFDKRLKDKITYNILLKSELLVKLQPRDLLVYMPCVNTVTQQKINREANNDGDSRATGTFFDEVWKFHGWGKEFLDALHLTQHADLANKLCPGYQPSSDDNNRGDSSLDDTTYGSGRRDRHSSFSNSEFSGMPRNKQDFDNPETPPPSYQDDETIPKRVVGGYGGNESNDHLLSLQLGTLALEMPTKRFENSDFTATTVAAHEEVNNTLPLRAHPRNELSSTPNLSKPHSSGRGIASFGHRQEDNLSSNIVREHRRIKNETPDQPSLKKLQTSLNDSHLTNFSSVSLPFSSEVSHQSSSWEIKYSEDDIPAKNFATAKETNE